MTPDQVRTVLAGTPERLARLTTGLSPAELRVRPEPEEWSANEVLAHLRACADVWGDCISAVVADDHPTIRAVNPTTWIKQTDYVEQQFEPSLQAFTIQRSELLTFLGSLGPDDWSRAATVTGAGRPRPKTVLDYASRLARHERAHQKQVESVVRALSGPEG